MERKLVIIITKEDGMTKRELIGDKSLEREEMSFVSNEMMRRLFH